MTFLGLIICLVVSLESFHRLTSASVKSPGSPELFWKENPIQTNFTFTASSYKHSVCKKDNMSLFQGHVALRCP